MAEPESHLADNCPERTCNQIGRIGVYHPSLDSFSACGSDKNRVGGVGVILIPGPNPPLNWSRKPTGTNIMGRRPHDLTQYLWVIEYPCPSTQQQGLHARLRSETCFPTHWLVQHLESLPCIDPIYILMDNAIHDMHGTVCFVSPASTLVTK